MELTRLTATELAPLFRSLQLSPVEVTDAYLDRIEQVDPALNTYMAVLAEQARAEARAAEAAIGRGEWKGPLHGVPLGIKDLYDVAGVPNTAGSKILAQNTPTEDGAVVQRLREAGAVILGKQQMHEFAFGVTSENPHYGPARNPWDVNRVTGGSSGGTASAVAAGLCVAGLGTDTGGSIRIPAALCGIAGIKPTYGRVSRRGMIPLAGTLDHAGPLARSVEDLAIILQAIAGHDPLDDSSADRPVPDFRAGLGRGVAGLRLGVPQAYFFELNEPGVARAVQDAIKLLAEQGAEIVAVDLPSLSSSQTTMTPIIGGEAAVWHEVWLKERPSDYGDDVRLRLEGGALTLATAYLKAQQSRQTIQAEFATALSRVDVILTPTVGLVAPLIGRTMEPHPSLGIASRTLLNRNTCPENLAGLPAATVPCGLVDGLPVGLQIVGAAWQEALVLQVAHAYEQASGWTNRQPVT